MAWADCPQANAPQKINPWPGMVVHDDEPADELVDVRSWEFLALTAQEQQFVFRLNGMRAQLCPRAIRRDDRVCVEKMNEIRAEISQTLMKISRQASLHEIDRGIAFLELRTTRLFVMCNRSTPATRY